MNENNKEILNSLSIKEYKNFIKNALGFIIFNSLNREDHLVLKSKKPKNFLFEDKNINKKEYIAYLYDDEKLVNAYYVDKENYYKKTFGDFINETYNTYDYFDVIKDSAIFFILLASKEKDDFSYIIKNSNDVNQIIESIDINKFNYSFILGTGISSYFDVMSWDNLIDSIKQKLAQEINTSEDKLEEFQKDIGNTNYIIPQIKKDYDKNTYFNIIYDGLYRRFNFDKVNNQINKDLENQTIYQVANIINVQTIFNERQNVLTFNYDNFLELVLEKSFSQNNVNSIYKNGIVKEDNKINIIHSHGYLPLNGFNQTHKDSIILSSFEYMDAYENSKSYAYKNLYEQLNKTNLIIGNRISDYEEQKVFRNHHKEYLSKYSFALFKKSDEIWMDAYKTKYFFSIGVIPLFFNDFSEITQFLRDRIVPLDN